MVNRIEVGFKEGKKDPIAEGILNLSKSAGIPLEGVERIRAYTIDSDMAPNEIQGLCRDLFTDPIVEVSSVDSPFDTIDKSAGCTFNVLSAYWPSRFRPVLSVSLMTGYLTIWKRPESASASGSKASRRLVT